jgi:hypothetical protein
MRGRRRVSKKLVVELDEEGQKNVFSRNKWQAFLNYIQKTSVNKGAPLVKGVKAFLIEEDGGGSVPLIVPDKPFVPKPVTPEDIARAEELATMNDEPDTDDLPVFNPFGDKK